MAKSFGAKPYLFPMPTYMIGTCNEDGTSDVMMMAWGGICAEDMVARSGLHAAKSERVDAPVIAEYPLTLLASG